MECIGIVKLDSQDITILYLHVNWEGLSEGNIIIRGPMRIPLLYSFIVYSNIDHRHSKRGKFEQILLRRHGKVNQEI